MSGGQKLGVGVALLLGALSTTPIAAQPITTTTTTTTTATANDRSVAVVGNGNDVKVTVMGDTQVYNVGRPIDEDLLRRFIVTTVQKAGAQWKTVLQSELGRLARVNEVEFRKIETAFSETSSKISDLQQRMEVIGGDGKELLAEIAFLSAWLQRVVDLLLAQRTDEAAREAEAAERAASDYDRRAHVGLDLSFGAFSSGRSFGRLAGTLEHETWGFQSARKSILTLVFGFAYGWDNATQGGFQDPTGQILTAVDYTGRRFMLVFGPGFLQELAPRLVLSSRLPLRFGLLEFTPRRDDLGAQSSAFLQVPLTVGLRYRPWPVLALGASVGSGLELFAADPIRTYSGVGAESHRVPWRTKAFLEAEFRLEVHFDP